jgi:hypothetical protein
MKDRNGAQADRRGADMPGLSGQGFRKSTFCASALMKAVEITIGTERRVVQCVLVQRTLNRLGFA